MDTRPSDELISKWRADYAAELDELKRQALEDFDRRWSENSSTYKEPSQPASTRKEGSTSAQRRSYAPRSASRPITINQMVLRVLPEFRGQDFTTGDVKRKILDRWPTADSKYLQSRISQLLKDRFEEGKLERLGRGPRIQDPIIYRIVSESDKETL